MAIIVHQLVRNNADTRELLSTDFTRSSPQARNNKPGGRSVTWPQRRVGDMHFGPSADNRSGKASFRRRGIAGAYCARPNGIATSRDLESATGQIVWLPNSRLSMSIPYIDYFCMRLKPRYQLSAIPHHCTRAAIPVQSGAHRDRYVHA